jgi:hypothetical protein
LEISIENFNPEPDHCRAHYRKEDATWLIAGLEQIRFAQFIYSS